MSPLALVKSAPGAPLEPEKRSVREPVPEEMLKCSYHPPDADFYCWRFKLWYNSVDCAYRTKHHTFEGCSQCSQGDLNLRTHHRELLTRRYLGDAKP